MKDIDDFALLYSKGSQLTVRKLEADGPPTYQNVKKAQWSEKIFFLVNLLKQT